MNIALAVYDALRTFARPATRLELERESGLPQASVSWGLRTLLRHGVLIVEGEPRKRTLYSLVPGSPRPTTSSGKYERDEHYRERMANLARAHRDMAAGTASHAPHHAAAPTSHASAPGGARMVVRGVLDIRHQRGGTFAPCALAAIWKK